MRKLSIGTPQPLALGVLLTLLVCSAGRAQDKQEEPLRLVRVALASGRTMLSDSWAPLEIAVNNRAAESRQARVVAFYSGQNDVQYARDIWVPGNSTVTTWMLVGPPPEVYVSQTNRDLETLLYDRTGGQDRLVLPPSQERIRSRPFPYKAHERATMVVMDQSPPDGKNQALWGPAADEVEQTVSMFRTIGGQRAGIYQIPPRLLPATPEGFDGLSQCVLAAHSLNENPTGELALRRWVEQGGTLWIMLDLVDMETVARLLADSLPCEVVDRTSLSRVQIQTPNLGPDEQDIPVDFEQPVDFVRVILAPLDSLVHTVNGWPASFTRRVGKGQILFTTVGARGWLRTRLASEAGNFEQGGQTIGVRALQVLNSRFAPTREPQGKPADPLAPLVTGDVGYSVPGIATAGLVFGGFLATVLIMGIALRYGQRPEWTGWCGPAAALAASAVFLSLGETTRNAVPATLAVTEIVEVTPASSEQRASGTLGLFRPNSGPLPLASTGGGTLDLDMSGVQGQTRRRVVTDSDAWHWENLALPAGLRLGPLSYSLRTGQPVSAVAQFGPDGLSGLVTLGPYGNPSDAIISTAVRHPVAASLETNGSLTTPDDGLLPARRVLLSSGIPARLTVRNDDLLPAGQFFASAVLSDRQQRRAELYRWLLLESDTHPFDGRDVLLTWSEPPELPFSFVPDLRTVASTLLVIPLEFTRPPANTHLTVSRAFLPYQRILQGRASEPTLESRSGADMRLRFQVPASLLPMEVESARLFVRVHANGRRLAVAGVDAGDKLVELWSDKDPTGTIEVPITQAALLHLDKQGGLFVNVAISELVGSGEGAPDRWSIEALELEVTGRTLPEE
jgi:hypothetical protein